MPDITGDKGNVIDDGEYCQLNVIMIDATHCSLSMNIHSLVPVYTWGTDQSSLELSDRGWTLRVGSLLVLVDPEGRLELSWIQHNNEFNLGSLLTSDKPPAGIP